MDLILNSYKIGKHTSQDPDVDLFKLVLGPAYGHIILSSFVVKEQLFDCNILDVLIHYSIYKFA